MNVLSHLLRVTLTISSLVMASLWFSALANDNENKLYISGRVKEALGKTDLTDALVVILDSQGNPADSCVADKGMTYLGDGEYGRLSDFGFSVPRCDSTYVMEVSCPRYTTQTITFTVSNVGKRESYRNIPVVFLERAPRQLDELTVTATKVKFYNRGDTLVYNADAFELAEGSMLDALIEQLPGVELKEGGQILVNGEQVEELLLNGKDFFDNNNELMLENIGVYTVKNIEVYKGYNNKEKWTRDTIGQKHLTMDVRLKR